MGRHFAVQAKPPSSQLLQVAVLGPPNAGKSTLFNRLVTGRALLSESKKQRRKRRTRAGVAIVSPIAGTTRDRRQATASLAGLQFSLMDTAGVDGERLDQASKASTTETTNGAPSHPDSDHRRLMQDMMRQTAVAAKQADVILFLLDARTGLTTDVLDIARWLRRHQVATDRVLMMANKLEGWDGWGGNSTYIDGKDDLITSHLEEAARVGFGPALPCSALHGEGMAELASYLHQAAESILLPQDEEDVGAKSSDNEEAERPLQLAILGRQNVGKSTLVNALLKENRVLTGPTPGLTRDSIRIEWSWKGRPVQLVDTAGIRRKRHFKDRDERELEEWAVDDAMKAVKVAEVAVLVIDAEARMLRRQELTIADTILKEGRSLIVVANKMDLIVVEPTRDEENQPDTMEKTLANNPTHRSDSDFEEGDEGEVDDDPFYSREDFVKDVRNQLEGRFPFLRKTPIIATSALNNEAVGQLMPAVFQARERWNRTVPTGQLNRWLQEVTDELSPPMVRGRPIRIKYITQTKGRPPTFLLFCNTDELPDSYMRYLKRHFQDSFQMFGMDVRLLVKKSASSNPHHDGKRSRSGSGLGGRQARQERMIKQLKTTGALPKRRRRKTR